MGCATLRLRWIAAPAVAVAAAASPARAATPGAAALDNRREAVVWTGHVTRGAEPSNAVPECSLTACDEFELRLDLSSGTFNRRRGGVEVSMRWFSTFGDNLRLYVYRHGALVAKSDGIIASAQSDGIIASAQSVLIPSPADGRYTVYAAFDPDSFGDGISYEGLAQVEYAPRAEPRRPLLPDLIALSQRNITFETPLDFGFEPPPTPGDSCFGSEKDEEGAQFGVESLTPSEACCARLAATGRTNREIAQDLFVSLRAVEMHLSSAYRKLGIRSRRELSSLDLADGDDLGGAGG